MSGDRLLPADHALLLDLLDLPTAGPLETGPGAPPPRLAEAQLHYACAAARIGLDTVHHGPAGATDLDRPDVPLTVRQAAAAQDGFLACQPNLVLRLGPPMPLARTVMFNVHLDTVAGHEPVSFDGRRFLGRGAIDAKGPAVALLAGIRAARAAEPLVGTAAGVLVQAVSGEEGGAMGTFGTRVLVEAGHVGALNVFCEPTGLRYLPRATAAATARLRVRGEDAVDDCPGDGHNATVLLGYLAQHLARELGTAAAPRERVCIAGIGTGPLHNRVYGRGELLLNIPYQDAGSGRRTEAAVESAVRSGLAAFRREFAGVPEFARTAADCAEVTGLDWLKRGLPTLDGADPALESLLQRAGIDRWPAHEPAFTCDAIWAAGLPDTFTVVLGPGGLAANRAHAEGEFADLDQLDGFAAAVARLLVAFARR
ncbi:M20/M25/M40 family metallo-hydrolase [Kitasatospora sp. DSM 101779]|uniref:M20/M25/M40 family metallo-hydrolase n=1 Tax=Kitasatospora sp. DSM 101779 TaxID=2853165 RepID=UPI0021DB05FE|nr:M20/M25/M40 family metallo-hydrolase [Kitasatospora sp. DSM 101779]MCU7826539.1 M20/M25/M40 family metallo-hydrolase [Kitasatospora sp. DSM 101779]